MVRLTAHKAKNGSIGISGGLYDLLDYPGEGWVEVEIGDTDIIIGSMTSDDVRDMARQLMEVAKKLDVADVRLDRVDPVSVCQVATSPNL